MSTFLIQFIDANQTQNCNFLFPTKTNFSLCRLWKKFTNRKQFWNKRLAQKVGTDSCFGNCLVSYKKGKQKFKKNQTFIEVSFRIDMYFQQLSLALLNFKDKQHGYHFLLRRGVDITQIPIPISASATNRQCRIFQIFSKFYYIKKYVLVQFQWPEKRLSLFTFRFSKFGFWLID